jgi:hypothetical protein
VTKQRKGAKDGQDLFAARAHLTGTQLVDAAGIGAWVRAVAAAAVVEKVDLLGFNCFSNKSNPLYVFI